MNKQRGRLLGIDHGAKVIGLAVCDASWIVASPFGLLVRTTREADFAAINDIIAEQQITGIVVGLPEVPDEFSGVSQANTVRRWITRLAAAVQVPVYTWDERYSTFEAQEIAAEIGVERKGHNGRIDDRAAAIILQGFIDSRAT